MSRELIKICCVLLMCVAYSRNELIVESSGYTNVLVSFAQNVPHNGGRSLLENLKSTLNDASEVLHTAVGIRISKVKIFIPKSWDVSEWNITVESSSPSQSNFKADILVDAANDSVFGKFPFAQQFGSCSTPGHQIVIPSSFWHEANTFPKGITLAREWLKYRYGVFDENGFLGDELYPLYYTIPGNDSGDVQVTDCTNIPLKYHFIDKDNNNCSKFNDKTGAPDENECSLVVDEEENIESVTSSLMYFQEQFRFMRNVCGKDPEHQHSSRSPNKHNALCRGQSIWDVVKTSEDFQVKMSSEGNEEIEFSYVQESNQRVVIAWENTEKMKDKGAIVWSAIKRFVYELPKGSKSALFPFVDKITEGKDYYALRELNNWPNDWKYEDIPSTFSKPGDACVSCAISKALEIFSSDGIEQGGTIIIVASSSPNTDEGLLQQIQESKLCLMMLVFSNDGVTPEAFNNYINASSCGTLVEFSTQEDDINVFEKAFDAMENILPVATDDKITETKSTKYVSKDTSTTIDVDNTVEKVTFWIFSNIESDSMNFKFGDQDVEVMEEVLGNIMALSYRPQQAGEITFMFSYGKEQGVLTQVRATSKAGNYLSSQVITHDTTEKGSSVQMPIIIYAVIRFGAYPVQNAEVQVTVSRPNEKEVVFDMYDDGRGDPDITANDGVYSRYFTSFSEKGEYTVVVTVKNNGGLTKAGKLHQVKGYQSCCGSSLESGDLVLPIISKSFTTHFEAVSGRPKNGYKPSRIVDLKIESITTDKVTLKWTAPGAEADSGTVETYEIKCFTSQDDAVQHFVERGKLLNYTITPQMRGSMETFQADIGDFEDNMLYYIAIRARTSLQVSDTSNIVKVFIPDNTATTTVSDDGTGTENNQNVKKGSPDKKTVGMIIGIIIAVIVLVIILYLAVYFLFVKPKRREEKDKRKTNDHSETSAENNVLNPINFISADTIIKNHNEKMQAKAENKDPPIFKEKDFENKNSASTRTNLRNSNEEEPGYSQIQRDYKEKDGPVPPKSPKRTTFV